jgi:sigma-B regulation protein RsbU (phosphoserine phosphatase)
MAALMRQREQSRLTPIIFLTASEQAAKDIFLGYESGGVDYLLKPLNAEILRAKVRVFLDLADVRRRLTAEIAERIKAYEQLTESREELRRKNEEMQEDLRMAREVQQAMLAHEYPAFPAGVSHEQSRLHFSHRYISMSDVGGDFFTILSLSNTQALIFIADVMGHGVRSALVTAMLRAMLEEMKDLAIDPSRLLTQMNQDLHAILRRTSDPMFTTALCLIADLETHEFRFSSAGHPKPLILCRATGAVAPLSGDSARQNPALGLFADATYTTATHPLADGDVVLLYTDGIFEIAAPDGEDFGEARLASAAHRRLHEPVDAIMDGLLADARAFSGSADFTDDVCLLGVEVAGSGEWSRLSSARAMEKRAAPAGAAAR